MMPAALLADVGWTEIEELRTQIMGLRDATTLEDAAQRFAGMFADRFATIALTRVFVVTTYRKLPARDRAFVDAFAARIGASARVKADTLVLSLLATRGVEPAWNARAQSVGHLAIPLFDREFVDSAPMIAQLLLALDVDVAVLDRDPAIATRRMVGVRNGRFYVADASTALDGAGQHIIANRAFVARHAIRTVFGMGGAYLDGQLVVALMFSTETVDLLVVDRFPSLISNFKMATEALVSGNRVYREA